MPPARRAPAKKAVPAKKTAAKKVAAAPARRTTTQLARELEATQVKLATLQLERDDAKTALDKLKDDVTEILTDNLDELGCQRDHILDTMANHGIHPAVSGNWMIVATFTVAEDCKWPGGTMVPVKEQYSSSIRADLDEGFKGHFETALAEFAREYLTKYYGGCDEIDVDLEADRN